MWKNSFQRTNSVRIREETLLNDVKITCHHELLARNFIRGLAKCELRVSCMCAFNINSFIPHINISYQFLGVNIFC